MNDNRMSVRWVAGLVFLLASLQFTGRADDRTPVVSLVALIANPQAYAGQKVLVTGFCSLEFEGTAIYLHEEDYRRAMPPNSIWLSVESMHSEKPNPVHEHHCLVEGVFNSRPARNGRAGRLGQITRLELLPSRAEHRARVRE